MNTNARTVYEHANRAIRLANNSKYDSTTTQILYRNAMRLFAKSNADATFNALLTYGEQWSIADQVVNIWTKS